MVQLAGCSSNVAAALRSGAPPTVTVAGGSHKRDDANGVRKRATVGTGAATSVITPMGGCASRGFSTVAFFSTTGIGAGITGSGLSLAAIATRALLPEAIGISFRRVGSAG